MDSPSEKSRHTFWYSLARAVGFILTHSIYPAVYHGRKRFFSLEGPYILAANHQSFLDVFILALVCPREIRFLGKIELTRSRVGRYLLGQLHMITVSRHESDIAAMRKCSKVLREGHVLGIFPEGTRHLEEMMSSVEDGISLLALRENVPIMPVYIHGKPRPFRPVHVITGDAVEVPAGRTAPDRENAAALSDAIRQSFYSLRSGFLSRGGAKDSSKGACK